MDLLMDDLELLGRMGTDAQKWAVECTGNFPPEWRADPMTWGGLVEFLTTWFANAIEAGRDAGAGTVAPIDPEGVSGELVDGLTALASAHGGYATVGRVSLAMAQLEGV
jgi:hypothetical protein